MESHQASKVDTSGTAKAVISCFQKLGVSFDTDQIEMVGIPEEHISGQAFHLYHLTSLDETVSFEFQHNVCGRSIYAEGTSFWLFWCSFDKKLLRHGFVLML
ncbi:hypothetical protein TIFTF001_051841 [Ficus carica]|uniref:Dihydrodipicolinate reductase C-terminal domain-containing protein n=1 Tax=Ficus carica TaxID=3494 RepID=A0AA88EB35_FICCA|nr:hypothetical protein TIFTF001_051841 [Ficus carica]